MKNPKLKSTKVIDIVVEIVSDYFELEPKTIFGNTRKYYPKTARQIIHYLLRKYTKLGLQDIGNISLLYGRDRAHDHASVLFSCKSVENNLETDKNFEFDLNTIILEYKKITKTITTEDIEKISNKDLIYKLENIILEKNQFITELQKSIQVIKDSTDSKANNRDLKRLLSLDDETISDFCETRLKPYLLMLDSTIARNKQSSVRKIV